MTAADRQRLRAAIDARMRELVADDDTPRCAECGADFDSITSGCRRCKERHRDRRRGR